MRFSLLLVPIIKIYILFLILKTKLQDLAIGTSVSRVLPLKDKHYFNFNYENREVHSQLCISLNSLYFVNADKLTHAPGVKKFYNLLKPAAFLSISFILLRLQHKGIQSVFRCFYYFV